jgi:hypothetical protein
MGYFAKAVGVLDMDDFCLPNLFVWYPEAEFQQMYPDGVPPCKFHGCTKCVRRHAWMQIPRRGHSMTRNTAILTRLYYCAELKKQGANPHMFSGIDQQVLDYSPDYVKMRWRMDGFDLSHKSAISLSLLRQMRAFVMQGLSLNGFRESLIQQLREYHLMISIQWRAYVDHVRTNPPLLGRPTPEEMKNMHKDFVGFDSEEYDQNIPSLPWLVERVRLSMESNVEYKKRRMQLVDGRHLSGDHSFKLTKCISSGGSKPFSAIYCLLNEYGQVVAWWFTTGTSMSELENTISKIKQRHQLYGYEGPISATTNKCCQERPFWKRVFGLTEQPIETQYLAEEDVNEIRVVASPKEPQIASTIGVCDMFVGWISDEIMRLPSEQQVIVVDSEWRVGNTKADLLIICLPFSDYKVSGLVTFI